jgi:hypothetical protein
VLPEDFAQSTSQKNWIHCSCPDDVIYRPDAKLSEASSVRTTRNFRPNLPLCREASNCSSLHPSEHFSSTSGRLSVFDKLQDFFPKHSYGKFATTVQTTWIPVWTRSSIRQVSHSKSRHPDASLHGSDARATDIEIVYIRSTVRTTIPLVRTCESLIWKLRTAKVRPSGRQGTTVQTWLKSGKNFSEILENRSHSCSSRRPLSTVRTAPRFIKPDAHLNLQPIDECQILHM